MDRSTSSFCTPFCKDKTTVRGPTIGEIARTRRLCIPEFNANENSIDRSESRGIIGSPHRRKAYIPEFAPNREPALSQRCKMSAARY